MSKQNKTTHPQPIKESFSKGNTKPPSNSGRQAPPPPKPPKR